MHINIIITNTNDIYTCFILYISFRTGTLLIRVYPDFISIIKAVVIIEDNLDCCRYIDNDFHFCKSCYSMIIKKKIPKFGFANYINVLSYQKYPDILNDLTFVEKTFIVYVYPVILIIKLKSSSFDSFALYY